jgi:ABC-type uncharacterized transport system fused permease/ATPase subunit
MEDHLQIPNIMATLTYKKALSYLLFSIFILIASVVMTALFTTDLSQQFNSSLLQNEIQVNYPIAIIFGLVLLGGSIISLLMAIKNYYVALKLEKNGDLAEGIIINKWVDTLERRALYYVSYRFHEDMEAWDVISKGLYQNLSKGCNVPIRYLQHDPSVSRLDYERISA